MKQYFHDTIIVGTGCAGYNCADVLIALGKEDVAMVTEGRNMGTSRNTGSDKQTYYKLALSASSPDSVAELADELYHYGGMDGDIALSMAAGSVRSFMKLVESGVPFPQNEYGEFVGYKTDHSNKQRATSAGPLTSRYMTEALERKVLDQGINIYDGFYCIKILTKGRQVQGIVCIDLSDPEHQSGITLFTCNHLVMATGGEPGVYTSTVYPDSQSGCMGVLAGAGVTFANLHHWQYGLSSTGFKWNVSGSYQQVLPRYISTDQAGNTHDFLSDSYKNPKEMLRDIFSKGYEWPFDVNKQSGSSRIDLLVLEEMRKGNPVFLDFTRNPAGLEGGFHHLSEACHTYLKNSGALQDTPIKRLEALNPAAIRLYRSHGIDLKHDLLQIAVCAQHINGGVYVDANWQSDIRGLYVIGEAAGTFGPYRPGGSALNAAQVGAVRCAEHIVKCGRSVGPASFCQIEDLPQIRNGGEVNDSINQSLQRRMDRYAGVIRDMDQIKDMLAELEELLKVPLKQPVSVDEIKTYHRRLFQYELLQTFAFGAKTQGSIGSALVTNPSFHVIPTIEENKAKIILTRKGICQLIEPRPIPMGEQWFEAVWNASY